MIGVGWLGVGWLGAAWLGAGLTALPPSDPEPVVTLPPLRLATYVGGADRGAGFGAATWLGRAM